MGDMDLETELGVDSIKRVEILSDVQSQLGIEAQDVAALGRTRTVGEVVEAMKQEIVNASQGGVATPAPQSGLKSRTATPARTISLGDTASVSLTYAHLVPLPRPDVLSLNSPSNRPVVIVDDNTATTAELAQQFGQRSVVISLRGGNFQQRTGLKQLIVPDAGEESLKRTLNTIQSTYGVPGGFIYQHREDVVNDAEQLGWLLMLAKHASPFVRKNIDGGRTFFFTVSRMNGSLGLGSFSNGSIRKTLEGAVFGLAKTLDHEWQDVLCRGIDIAQGVDAKRAALYVMQEYSDPNRLTREVGYDVNGQRQTSRASDLLVPTSANEVKQNFAISSNDAFIVTGGARGITPLCVAELARRVSGGTYFLLGRSPIISEPSWARRKDGKDLDKACISELKRKFKEGSGPKPTPRLHKTTVRSIVGSREVNASLSLIEANGGRAIYVPCDVMDKNKVRQVIQNCNSQYGVRISGIIHASGVLRDKAIENKTVADFNLVYGTKVQGLLNVFDNVDMGSLKHLVMFSSLAGFHGNTGQSDYAMANDVLNKIGHFVSFKYPQCRVRALDFGPWDGGMVTPALKAHSKSAGVQIIPRDEGAEIVASILTSSEQVQCLVGNWLSPPVKCLRDRNTLVRRVGRSSSPFVESHKIKGKAVLPMTVATGTLASIPLQLNPGYFLEKVEELKLFSGLILDSNDMKLEFASNLIENRSGKLVFDVLLKNIKANGKKVPGYKAKVTLTPKRLVQGKTPRQFDVNTNNATTTNLYDGKTLFHGAHFHGISKVLSCGANKITTECYNTDLSMKDMGNFPVVADYCDQYNFDISLQTALVWARQLRSAAALPTALKNVEFYSPFPSSGESYYTTLVRNGGSEKDSSWNSTAYMHDARGNLFLKADTVVTINENMSY